MFSWINGIPSFVGIFFGEEECGLYASVDSIQDPRVRYYTLYLSLDWLHDAVFWFLWLSLHTFAKWEWSLFSTASVIFGEQQINQVDLSTRSICHSLQIGLTVNTKDNGDSIAIVAGEKKSKIIFYCLVLYTYPMMLL